MKIRSEQVIPAMTLQLKIAHQRVQLGLRMSPLPRRTPPPSSCADPDSDFSA